MRLPFFGRGLAHLEERYASDPSRNTRRRRSLAVETLEPRIVLDGGSLVISELMALNHTTLPDEETEPDYPDWIEIYNPTNQTVDLDGWYLTDDVDRLDKWEFPSIDLDPHKYLVVFASEKDRRNPARPLHTNFELDAGGEYLALVMPDGSTVVSQFAPAFPAQPSDVSYGTTSGSSTFVVPEDAQLTYHVPTAADAALGTSWTATEFDDSSWGAYRQASRVLITEVGTADPDYVEIQNVTDGTVDTSGWVVVANVGTTADVNRIHTPWQMPDLMTPTQILYRNDDPLDFDHFWGEEVFWRTSGAGWVMIVDDAGTVVDFVIWGYLDGYLENLDFDVAGHRITADDIWSGDVVTARGDNSNSMQRTVAQDTDTAADWHYVVPKSPGSLNAGLTVPHVIDVATGVGFDAAADDFDSVIQIDVESAMYGENSSLWMRFPFELSDPERLDSLQLQMRYNDGFAAYLNGVPVTDRNAPQGPQWNAAATGGRSVQESLAAVEIDLTGHLDQLRDGRNVLAIHGLNAGAADGNFLIRPELAATGMGFFSAATPGAANGAGVKDLVKDTKFSVDRGFYSQPQSVSITTATPGAFIRYTTDGTEPTETNGRLYTAPITVEQTTTLRARAFKPGYEPTDVDTQTYIFVDDVVRQDLAATLAAGLPSSWGGVSADYGMDPQVIGTFNPITGTPNGDDNYGGRYAATVRDDLKSLPTLSIVMDADDMFGSNGIYTHSTQHGVNWERATSAELIYPDGSDGFQIDCGIRIQGGWFRNTGTKKHSLRLLFKGAYGQTKLDYPWFGETAVAHFDTLTLRAGANDGYTWSSARLTEQFTRDQFGRSLQEAAGQVASHGTFVHLYINGVYWGFYNPVERPDDAFSAAYFGGEKEDWDSIHDNSASGGNMNAWSSMISQSSAARTSLSAYQRLQGNNLDGTRNLAYADYLDVTNYIDYMAINLWGGNWDWPNKNYWAGRDRTDASTGFKFYNWDFENTMGNNRGRSPLNMVAPRNLNGAGQPHANLRYNSEYKMEFGDRVHRMFFNDGILTPNALRARYGELADEVEAAVVAESARWGDTHHSTPLTQQEWINERNWLMNTYLVQRSGIVLQQFRNSGLYPTVVAPSFEVNGGYQHGGLLEPADELTIDAAAGTVYYTLDGTDPREFGGSISGDALRYTNAPITLNASTQVKSRLYSGGKWSALNEATFYVHQPASAANLAISEINYNPFDPTPAELATQPPEDPDFTAGDFEFIEIFNTTDDTTVDLLDVEFTDGVVFPLSDATTTLLGPGEYLVLVANPVAFAARYGELDNVGGTYTGQLDNGGERLRLVGAGGESMFAFRYEDDGSWPGRADGKGASLELVDPTDTAPAAYATDVAWHSSAAYGGTPGTGPMDAAGIAITEVLTHTDAPLVDAVELHNTTDTEVDLGGWYLSDDWGWAESLKNDDYKKFRIPDGTTIGAGEYLVFYEGHYDDGVLVSGEGEFGGLGQGDFSLNGAKGDHVWLMEADAAGNLTRFGDHVEFPAAAAGESFGRWPDATGRMVPMAERTLGETNGDPRVGPIVFSEIMYQPADGGPEYLELFNPTPRPVPLFDPAHPENTWRVAGIDYDFPGGVTVAAGGVVLVVPIQPSAFRVLYDVPAEVQILGPYAAGKRLDNTGERLRLWRPDEPTISDASLIVPRILVDELDYLPGDPWPAAAGTGDSLHRVAEDSWGDDPGNWQAVTPSPGVVPWAVQPRVEGVHVFYNNSAFDNNDTGTSAADDGAVAPDKQALLPGNSATFANYTSFSQGLNGIMVDVANMSGEITAADFRFRVGNNPDPSSWADAPAPTAVAVRVGAGVDGSDRVTITWADFAIRGTWLEITALADRLGLADDAVFYVGNAVAEAGNSPNETQVTTTDLLLARNNPRNFLDPAEIDYAYDYNRDQRVNATDVLLARNNQTNFLTMLRLLDL